MTEDPYTAVAPSGCGENLGVLTWGRPPADAVLVVTGLARSGTTSAAELVSTLLPLFFDRVGNLEDYRFAEALQEKSDASDASDLIASRPSRWACKRPFAWTDAGVLQAVLGPRLCWLVTVRDCLSVATREQMANGGDVETWLIDIQARSEQMHRWFNSLRCPRALVSCEKLLTHRGPVRTALAAWLNEETE